MWSQWRKHIYGSFLLCLNVRFLRWLIQSNTSPCTTYIFTRQLILYGARGILSRVLFSDCGSVCECRWRYLCACMCEIVCVCTSQNERDSLSPNLHTYPFSSGVHSSSSSSYFFFRVASFALYIFAVCFIASPTENKNKEKVVPSARTECIYFILSLELVLILLLLLGTRKTIDITTTTI